MVVDARPFGASPKTLIMGERNSSTNYLAQLLAKNSLIESVAGVAPKAVRGLASVLPVREQILDLWFRGKVWKHAYLDAAALEVVTDLKIIAISKHPLAWSVSMLRRPYHVSAEGKRGVHGTLEDWHSLMLRTWPTQKRERIEPDSGFNLWATKYQSYLQAENVLMVRYEDLLSDPEKTLETIAAYLNVEVIPSQQIQTVNSSTKSDKRTTESISSYYLEELWRNELPSDYESYLTESAVKVAAELGYTDL